ncbi:hypothetical protein IV102_26580 [bacterium]|nr:hypothetical protein [bacterium]
MNVQTSHYHLPPLRNLPTILKDDKHKDFDEQNFSWLDLGKGVVGSVFGGVIDGTGAAVASVIKSPRITFEAVRGVWKSKMLGPVLKSTLTPVILTAGLVTPVLATLAGLGYGMFEGFSEGSAKSPLAAITKSIDTCKQMHGKFTKQVVEGIREMATKEPDSPEEVYEIKVIEAGKGLISSAASAAIDGVGIGGTMLLHLPQGYFKVSKELWKSDAALPLKVGGQFLATAGAVLAVPLATVGGALYGLGKGAYNGYQQGMLESVKLAGKDVSQAHNALTEFVQDK